MYLFLGASRILLSIAAFNQDALRLSLKGYNIKVIEN
jgi:hypothetical protein